MAKELLDLQQSPLRNSLTLGLLAEASYAEAPASDSSFTKTTFTDCVRFRHAATFTDGFVTSDERNVVVAFRGTSEPADWITNGNVKVVKTEIGAVHAGFLAAADAVERTVTEAIARRRKSNQTLWFTGHSLGGAIATLAAVKYSAEFRPLQVVTFGQPRVGTASFARAFRRSRVRHWRFVNNNDIVPTLPSRLFPATFPPQFYEHVGDLQFFDAAGKLIDRSDEELGIFPALSETLASIRGSESEAARLITAGIRDHAMAKYLQRIRQNLTA